MVTSYIFHEYVHRIQQADSHEEQLFAILQAYSDIFPVGNATLSRYSSFGYLGEGIISLEGNQLEYISEMRDDIRSIPLIYDTIKARKAQVCQGIDCLKRTSSKYKIAPSVHAISVTPICNGSTVLGFICTTKFADKTILNDDYLETLTQYGHLVGQYMGGVSTSHASNKLSKREIEVMSLVSLGERSKEIASILGISELTVNQYIQASIKKLQASNRVHAVSILLREGLLS